jgi:hypothetical protein
VAWAGDAMGDATGDDDDQLHSTGPGRHIMMLLCVVWLLFPPVLFPPKEQDPVFNAPGQRRPTKHKEPAAPANQASAMQPAPSIPSPAWATSVFVATLCPRPNFDLSLATGRESIPRHLAWRGVAAFS